MCKKRKADPANLGRACRVLSLYHAWYEEWKLSMVQADAAMVH